MATKWIGSGDGSAPECDFAKAQGVKHNMAPGFVDGRTIYGPWALMCIDCHTRNGVGLGTGKGQKYDGTTLEKVEG
jgi:hypothetical protein